MIYAFTLWLHVPGRGRIKIGVPVGMTAGDLEDALYERYPGWSTIKGKTET